MSANELETTDFTEEGFTSAAGRQFMVEGHSAENNSGLLGLKVVVRRDASEEVIELGNKQGLQFARVFDNAHPGLVMLETIGGVNLVEHLAKNMAAGGYHRIG